MKRTLLLLTFALVAVMPFSAASQEQIKALTFSEEMPDFPGGVAALMKFLEDNLVYPPEAAEKGISGKVFIGFIVDTDGSITNAKVVRGVETTLDNEALRVVKIMPKWKPGRNKGEAVPVSYSIPIVYKLSGDTPAQIDLDKAREIIKTLNQTDKAKAERLLKLVEEGDVSKTDSLGKILKLKK
ncbi:MAG: energy transducer TonB [Prolixibacteraceae bacterium]|nr:energy transducer TonB [Prolixibacteraceae bacterium]